MLDAAARDYPARPFVITDERVWTYAEMREWSRAARRRAAWDGSGRGDQVAIMLANYPEFVALEIRHRPRRRGRGADQHAQSPGRARLCAAQSERSLLVTMDRFRDIDYLATLDD